MLQRPMHEEGTAEATANPMRTFCPALRKGNSLQVLQIVIEHLLGCIVAQEKLCQLLFVCRAAFYAKLADERLSTTRIVEEYHTKPGRNNHAVCELNVHQA